MSLIISKKKISQREKKQPWKFYVSQMVVDLAENAKPDRDSDVIIF